MKPVKTLTIGEFKAQFSAVLEIVKSGETVAITYGRKKTRIAALVPYTAVKPTGKRPLGLLEGKAGFRMGDDFKMDEEELLRA